MRTTTAALLVALAAGSVHAAAVITVVDGPGVGFNDTTPVSPVGGNPGTTLGAQRLAALQSAADTLVAAVNSAVDIQIHADFTDQGCGNQLGLGGPAAGYATVIGSPPAPLMANYIYPIALANKLVGSDLCPVAGSCSADHDINVHFNSKIDDPGCMNSFDFYYGFDGNTGGDVDFLSVALHEASHGLGFATWIDRTTGKKPIVTVFPGPMMIPVDDPYDDHLEDHSTGMFFPTMTDAERLAASTNAPNLHWVGPNVITASTFLTAGRTSGGHVEMFAPAMSSGSAISHFSTSLFPDEIMEPSLVGVTHDITLTRAVLRDMGFTDCGDGVIQGDETCDDGDTDNGDGCDVTCHVEACWTCTGEPSSCSVDDGAPCASDGNVCTMDVCSGGACTHPPDDGGPCPDEGDDCTSDVCSGGSCAHTPQTGTPCDDGNICTTSDTCTAGVCGGTNQCTLDHYLTYKVKVTPNTPKFVAFGTATAPVVLHSDFESSINRTDDTQNASVTKIVTLGLPADKNGEGIFDPNGVNGIHLEEYAIKSATSAPLSPPFVPLVQTVNQCGSLTLVVGKPASLMVPTAKNLSSPPSPPVSPDVDHMKCYKVKLATGSPVFPKGVQVVTTDQFAANRRFDLKKVTKLCVPTDKLGTPTDKLGNPVTFTPASRRPPQLVDSFICYQAKLAKALIPQTGCGPTTPGNPGTLIVPAQAKHTKVLGMYTANQFGPGRLDSVKENELCVPTNVTCTNCP